MASQIARALPPGESFLKDKSRPDDGRLERALRLAGRKVRTWNLKRTPLKRESKGRKAELRKYHLSASAFFAEPGNDVCHICLKLREDGDDIRLFPSTERHHFRGRIGRLLNWKPGWIPSCNHHRQWPHQNPVRARKLGLLAEAKDWNVYPGE